MKKKILDILKLMGLCLFALIIPGLLIIDGIQGRKYAALRQQVLELEQTQAELIEENKKLITDISILSSADRIEKLAQDRLDMRKAETDEIIRVEIKDGKNERK